MTGRNNGARDKGLNIMRSTLIALAFSVSLASGAAVAQTSQPQQRQQPLNLSIDPASPRAESSITPLDKLSVTVFREPDLSVAEVAVDESGRVVLPMVGAVSAAGKSTESLSTEIADRLRRYLRNPQVAVTVKQAASRRITVTGSVVQPGVYPLEGRLTLLQAVALAQGPSTVAALDQALVMRVKDGQRSAARFDLNAISKGKAADPEVISGDTVAIGSSKFKTAWRDVVASIRSFNIFSLIP